MAQVKRKPAHEAPVATVDIAGVNFETRSPSAEGLLHVPSVNPAYQWHPRTFDIAMDIKENRWVMLTGHAGTGKSSIPEQIAARINQPCVRPAVGGGLSFADLVGFWTVKNGSTEWVDGILVKAMQEGWWLVIDEIDFVDPNILSALNGVLEPVKPHSPHRKFILKEKGHEVITAHEDFRIVTTANTVGALSGFRHLYQGAVQMNYALLTRCRMYVVGYLPADIEKNVLLERFPRLKSTPDLAEEMVKVANLIREGFTRQELPEPMSLRQLEDWVEMMLRHIDKTKREKGKLTAKDTQDVLMTSADAILLSRVTDEESLAVVKGILERVLLGKKSEDNVTF